MNTSLSLASPGAGRSRAPSENFMKFDELKRAASQRCRGLAGRWAVRLALGLATGMGLLVSAAQGAMHSAQSGIVTVDTRFALTGSILGQVWGNGAPLTGAQVRVLDTPYATNSGGGGFTLTNVPSGAGYVVTVAATGFASTNILNVQVSTSPRNLGVITLRPLGAHKVIPLVPDLNPTGSEVQEGGVAYRYYRVVSGDGKTPAGGVTLQARVAGGAAIIQTGDIADNWPGREAGVSDADGVVRIQIPSSAIGSAGTTRKVEVLDGGAVAQSFDVSILPFKYEKVWAHSLEASVAGKLGVVRLEPGVKLETEVTHLYLGSLATAETIERTRSLTGKVGPDLSVGSFKLGVLKAGPKLGFGGYMDLQFSGKWTFSPDESDGFSNMQKVYYAFGDIIFLGPLGAKFYGWFSDNWYGVSSQDLFIVGSGGVVHLGGYFDGEVEFGIGKIGKVNVGAGAKLDGNVGGYLGYERSYGSGQIQEHTVLFGLEAEVQGYIGATAALAKFNQNRLRGLGVGLNFGAKNRGGGRITTDGNSGRVKSASIELENEISSGGKIDFLGWKGVAAPVSGDEKLAITESYTLAFGDNNNFSQLAALGRLWNAARPGSDISPQLGNNGFDESCVALAGAAEQSGRWPTYERKIRRAYEGEFSFPVGANTLAAALQLNFTAQTERGAAMVVERGVAPGGRLFPQEYQPDRSLSLIPADSVFSKELVWLSRAELPYEAGLSRFAEYVSTANPNLTLGGRFSMFFQDVAGGARIVGSFIVRAVSGGGAQRPVPQADETNYVYGVSGLLQLTPTNAFPGTVTLVMLYSDEQISGLNAADLRIYRLPDATNQWQLMGGSVNLIANSVTTVISNFGTYAIAPPMPLGRIDLVATNLNLVANGTNQLRLTATNLLLNTGAVASGPWLFTVDATGLGLVNVDVSTNWPGVQVVSSNGILELLLRAPLGGTYGRVSVRSVAGDAHGQIGMDLVDTVPPATPANVQAVAGQSRIWLSWRTNSEPDLAGYRVYYRAGTAGPPWDGAAAIEGSDSPVSVAATNCLLRGLAMGTSYFVSIAAVDTTGNESLLSATTNLTPSPRPPAPPTGVAVRFGEDGTNVLMWTLSEDDGYNDRDVTRYDVWRIVLPGTNWVKVAEVGAGIGLFSEANVMVSATQHVRYAVSAVDQLGASSTLLLGNRFIVGTSSVDNDGDGMADDWELANGLDPNNPADANHDPDHDGLTNRQEYQLGRNPKMFDNLHLGYCRRLANGDVELSVFGELGKSYALETSTNLVVWNVLRAFTCTNWPTLLMDSSARNHGQRFYRVAPLSAAGQIRLSFSASPAYGTNGVELKLDAPIGLNYRIEASTNLVNWSTLAVLPGTNSPLYLRDSTAGNQSRKFYRAVVE